MWEALQDFWGAPRAQWELRIAPCVISVCFIFASGAGCLQKRLQWGEGPKVGLSRRSRRGLAQRWGKDPAPAASAKSPTHTHTHTQGLAGAGNSSRSSRGKTRGRAFQA